MDERKSIGNMFFGLMTKAFTCAVIAMAIAGRFMSEDATLFGSPLGEYGITYVTIFHLLALAAINSAISVFVTHSKFMRNIRQITQMLLVMSICLASSSGLLVAFGWITGDSFTGWALFIISFIVVFAVVSIIMIMKAKADDRRYSQLLEEYKRKQAGKKHPQSGFSDNYNQQDDNKKEAQN